MSPVATGLSARDRKALAEAEAALASGRLDRAATLSGQVLALNPADPDALNLAGRLALRTGKPDVALARLSRAAMARPRDGRLVGDVGRALSAQGKRFDAETAFRAALDLDSSLVEIEIELGKTVNALWRDDEAAVIFERILAKNPRRADVLILLGEIHLGMVKPREALAGADRALGLKPDMPEALALKGAALDMLGRVDEAVAVRRRLITIRHGAGSAWYDLGTTQMHHGRLADAEASFRAAIAAEPRRGNWHHALAHLVGHESRDADIAAMDSLWQSSGLPDDDRMHLGFGLGKALEDIGAYGEAFGYLLEGNRLKRQRLNYTDAETDRLFETIKAAFPPERFARQGGQGCPDPAPIFVLGMPRSSTSLVEQILAAHPEVAGGGEFRFVNQLVGQFVREPGFPLAATLDRADPAALRAMGERYIAHIRGISPDARFVTDKLPGNFIMIGFIRLILPNAKIIHCKRNPIDNCLSLFRNFFAAEHLRYAYDLAEIGHYYARYEDLMAHWRRVLPGVVHDVDYETLVADFDTEARRLVAHCGLDWRDECRAFFKAPRSVQTASAAQVRQPIFTTSIGQGERYGDRLKPLLDALARGI